MRGVFSHTQTHVHAHIWCEVWKFYYHFVSFLSFYCFTFKTKRNIYVFFSSKCLPLRLKSRQQSQVCCCREEERKFITRNKQRWSFWWLEYTGFCVVLAQGGFGYYVSVEDLRWHLEDTQRNWSSGDLSASSCGAPRPKPGTYCGGMSGSGGWQVSNNPPNWNLHKQLLLLEAFWLLLSSKRCKVRSETQFNLFFLLFCVIFLLFVAANIDFIHF